MAEVPFPEKEQIMRALGEVIRDCREARGLSKSRLARTAEIDPSYLAHLEVGINSPTVNMLWRLAKALDVSPSELIARLEKRVGGRTPVPWRCG